MHRGEVPGPLAQVAAGVDELPVVAAVVGAVQAALLGLDEGVDALAVAGGDGDADAALGAGGRPLSSSSFRRSLRLGRGPLVLRLSTGGTIWGRAASRCRRRRRSGRGRCRGRRWSGSRACAAPATGRRRGCAGCRDRSRRRWRRSSSFLVPSVSSNDIFLSTLSAPASRSCRRRSCDRRRARGSARRRGRAPRRRRCRRSSDGR